MLLVLRTVLIAALTAAERWEPAAGQATGSTVNPDMVHYLLLRLLPRQVPAYTSAESQPNERPPPRRRENLVEGLVEDVGISPGLALHLDGDLAVDGLHGDGGECAQVEGDAHYPGEHRRPHSEDRRQGHF